MEAQVFDEIGQKVGRFQVCDRPLARLRGLMFRRDLPADGLLFVFPAWRRHPRVVGIHAFFVFFPFAAIWLDEGGASSMPWRSSLSARIRCRNRPAISSRDDWAFSREPKSGPAGAWSFHAIHIIVPITEAIRLDGNQTTAGPRPEGLRALLIGVARSDVPFSLRDRQSYHVVEVRRR